MGAGREMGSRKRLCLGGLEKDLESYSKCKGKPKKGFK